MEGDLAGQHDGTIAVGIRHVLCVPLLVNPMSAGPPSRSSEVIGVLYLDGRERSTMLSEADAVVARGIRHAGGAGDR